MEHFEITVDNIIYHIEPQEDESFNVYEAGIKIGSIFPELEDSGLVWKSLDLITPEHAQLIGEEIENYEM
jgi:hypothetical protein